MIDKRKILGKVAAISMTVCSIVGSCFVAPNTVSAKSSWPKGPNITSKSAVVMEVNTGTVLYEKNAHDQHYPASITKILTTLLCIENSSMDEKVTFSADAVYNNEGTTSNIARDYQEVMTMEQCLYGVMLESANECAYAVAEHVGVAKGGDYRTFIDLMNQKAKSLGCTDSHFNNCNGLPDPEHKTSAYDMALISCEAYKNEEFRTITGTKNYTIPPTNKHKDPTPLNNHHKNLHIYEKGNYVNEYCTGGKTGYTTVANSTLVTYAEKDGMAICVVVMDTQNPNHFIETNELIEYSFTNFQALNIVENEKTLTINKSDNKGILNNNKSFVTLDENACIILPNTAQFTDAKFEKDEDVADKNTISSLKYTFEGRDVGSVSIVTTGAKVEENFYVNKPTKNNSKVVKVKPIVLIICGILFILLIGMLVMAKRIYDNFYLIRHNRMIKKMDNERFAGQKKRRRRRKKDAFFD